MYTPSRTVSIKTAMKTPAKRLPIRFGFSRIRTKKVHAKSVPPTSIVIGRKQFNMEMTIIGQSAAPTAADPLVKPFISALSRNVTAPQKTKSTARFPTAPETAEASACAQEEIRLNMSTGQIRSIPSLQMEAQDSQRAFSFA